MGSWTLSGSAPVVNRLGRIGLGLVTFSTGASALVLQVTWHRVISLHAGIDLAASTTVVAAFLAGLGVGNLGGGRLADRLTPARALRALAAAEVGLAVYAWFSIAVLYDLYRSVASDLSSTVGTLLFNAAVLFPATVLFGMSLPLVARAVTGSIEDAGRLVGRYNSINTLGAAFGALYGGWRLIGTYGYPSVTRMCAVVHLLAAVALVALSTTARPRAVEATSGTAQRADTAKEPRHAPWPASRWYLLYGLTGAMALGFEQVFFRLIDGVMRSNAYTFAHVLGLYLLLWAVGAAIGSVLVTRVADQRAWFLWMQCLVGVGGIGGLIALVHVVPRSPAAAVFQEWFASPGLAYGIEIDDRWLFGLVVPIALMAVPVVLFGAIFPFAEALASRDLAHVGRTTGRLLGASLAGNVAGAIVTSFVLIEHLGTAGTIVALSLPMIAVGIVASGLAAPGRIAVQRVAVVAVAAVLLWAVPSNVRLWSALLSQPVDSLTVAEDRACASVLTGGKTAEGAGLTINGRGQNGYPFDDFHMMVGLLPALAHPDPDHALAIGYGIGSTSYAFLASGRADEVTSIEICPGNYVLSRDMARRGAPEFERLEDDPAHRMLIGDGRKHLLVSEERYDLVVPDTLVPSSSGSTNLHSVEFFESVDERLDDGGILATWSSTPRVAAAVATIFPYVVRVSGEAQPGAPTFLLASRSPIDLDPDRLLSRFDEIPADAIPPEQRGSLRALIADLAPECFNDGALPPEPDPLFVNRDLRPRDEFFLNGPGMGEASVPRTC